MKKSKAFIVIDMLKDFIREDGAPFCDEPARNIIPFIQKKLDFMRKKSGNGNLFLS